MASHRATLEPPEPEPVPWHKSDKYVNLAWGNLAEALDHIIAMGAPKSLRVRETALNSLHRALEALN